MSEEKLKRNSDKVVHYGMTKDGYTVGLKAKDVNHNLAHIRSILEEKSGRDVGVVNTVRSCIEAWWDIEGIDSPSTLDNCLFRVWSSKRHGLHTSDKGAHYGMTKDGYMAVVKAKDVSYNLAHIRSVLEEKLEKDVGVVNAVRSCIKAWCDIEGIDSPYPPPGANIDIKLLKKYQLYGVSIMSSWLCSKIHRGYGIKE